MERREVLLKCLGGAALALAPSKLLPATGTGNDRTGEFYELWEDACLSHYWFEDKRSYDLCLRALALAPENLESSKRADIMEKLGCLHESLEAAEEDLARQREALKAEPQNPEKHFYLGFTLTRLGWEEEAVAEYRLALQNPEGLCAHRYWDSWNNIGWYHYRQGMYREAVKWFERVCQLNDTGEFLQHYDRARAVENKLLAYSALRMTTEAEAATRDYITRFGRVTWPARQALARIGIDSDAMYVELQGPVT
jgi:tetratricopeptide (TPR) repeat protein